MEELYFNKIDLGFENVCNNLEKSANIPTGKTTVDLEAQFFMPVFAKFNRKMVEQVGEPERMPQSFCPFTFRLPQC